MPEHITVLQEKFSSLLKELPKVQGKHKTKYRALWKDIADIHDQIRNESEKRNEAADELWWSLMSK